MNIKIKKDSWLKIAGILCISIILFSCHKRENISNLSIKDGRFYTKDSVLYTGLVYKPFENGKDSFVAAVDSGYYHGNYIIFYKSGVVKDSIIYEKGTKVSFRSFTETGELQKTPSKQLHDINNKAFIIINNDTILFSGIAYDESTYTEDEINIEYYKETPYIDGVRYGISNAFRNKTLTWRGKFIDDKLEGIMQSWYLNGDTLELGYYQDGKRDGMWKSYYQGNKLKTIGKYVFGERDSIWNDYYENGNIKSEDRWRNGTRSGEFTDYYESGSIKQKGLFNQSGKREGHWVWYYEDGSVDSEERYKNGEILSKCKCCGDWYIKSEGWSTPSSAVDASWWSFWGSLYRGGPFCSSTCAVKCR